MLCGDTLSAGGEDLPEELGELLQLVNLRRCQDTQGTEKLSLRSAHEAYKSWANGRYETLPNVRGS